MKLAKRLDHFSEYIFADLNKKVKEVETRSGRPVFSLAIGNPDFPPSKKYVNKLQDLIKEKDAHHYPGYGATPIFAESLISWYKKKFEVEINDSELLPLIGSKDGITHLALTLLDEGDEVLIPDPGYPAYVGACLMVGAKPVSYNLTSENDFKINIEDIRHKISSKTKLIWLNFPSNPTGQIISKIELEKIVQLAIKHRIWIAYDNAYSEIYFGKDKPPSILEIPNAKKVAIEFNSLSKTFSLAGYRLGWAVGNNKLIGALAKVKSQFDSGLSLPLQRLAAFCFSSPDKEWRSKMLANYQQRAQILSEYLPKLGLSFSLPKASLYIWAKIPDEFEDSEEFSKKLLEEKQILVTPGTAFGENGKRYVRISISSNLERIYEYIR